MKNIIYCPKVSLFWTKTNKYCSKISIICSNYCFIILFINFVEPLKTGVKYNISDIADNKATSGHITFRHISDNIVSGNFEAQMVKTSNLDATEEPDQIIVTDGTFDLKY